MKVVALVSGGKDSCFAMMKCIHYGHQIVGLANLLPVDDSTDELDSYMLGTKWLSAMQNAWEHQSLSYKMTAGDEVEDMFILLDEVKRQLPCIEAVSSGAIASDYQRLRVESVCSRLGLVSLAYLWKQDQSLLLDDMIASRIVAILVKVAAMGLNPAKHLGKDLAHLKDYLHKLKELYGINVCGEGGEYETLTLDCPLFINARIVLDEFQIALHSSDSIAPVGVLHPLTFHLEEKEKAASLSGSDMATDFPFEKLSAVYEVQGSLVQKSEHNCQPSDTVSNIVIVGHNISTSKTTNSTFSLCCWFQYSCEESAGLKADLVIVLQEIERQLAEHGFNWEHVIYIHLYIDDMNEFANANETYVSFITQEKCPLGVPSRSTIELPLSQVGLGKCYTEVLVSKEQSKRVLHVQSISCWAPSCIGPYSQATLHKEILYMAGQLGLDPPTMVLCNGGTTSELEQALQNSEAVAECFCCSISTSAILFVIYCSVNIPSVDFIGMQHKMESVLKDMQSLQLDTRKKVLNPIFLYVLVPNLPKRALVEIKPVLYVPEDVDTSEETTVQNLSCGVYNSYWGFRPADWHHSCFEKYVVDNKICAIIISIRNEHTAKICSDFEGTVQELGDCQIAFSLGEVERVARFCIYLLDNILAKNGFSWEDIMTLRFYFPTTHLSFEELSAIFTTAFKEFSEMSKLAMIGEVPIFNLVPVLGSGVSANLMDDIISCELLAQKA
ncbi:Diphthamide synthase domain [Dillenia turbinata]|uniref:Diphthine--ammonia ligase n=1 Tax=Dillenia turbinata TaxID=194707 RepID=A0AAN8UM45_9MAGN